ncbi:MAG TPA: hypothetical protein VIA45_11300 [Thermoanaerobaculia bacterium]
MRPADLLPRFLLPPVSAWVSESVGEASIEDETGLSREAWADLGRAFPRLGDDPGPEAARARKRFGFLVGRALDSPRHGPAFPKGAPDADPHVYATAHVGDLRSLRYLMRRHVPLGNIVRTTDAERAEIIARDELADREAPQPFPHAFHFRQPHRLRSALRRGSLLAAADMPEDEGAEFSCLGGRLRLDVRPFRLARIAGVPCRAIFLTAPRGRLTVMIGPVLPADERAALGKFARALERVLDRSPFDIDAPTWWTRLGRP